MSFGERKTGEGERSFLTLVSILRLNENFTLYLRLVPIGEIDIRDRKLSNSLPHSPFKRKFLLPFEVDSCNLNGHL